MESSMENLFLKEVPCVDLCVALHRLGLNPDCPMYNWAITEGVTTLHSIAFNKMFADIKDFVCAPSIGQMTQWLPSRYNDASHQCGSRDLQITQYPLSKDVSEWHIRYGNADEDIDMPHEGIFAPTLADAMAKMLIWLLEKKFLNPENLK